MAEDEIVITEFIAANFGLGIGDTVTISGGLGSGEYSITGIYSCANDMGDNLGMTAEGYLLIGRDDPQIWCHHYFLADPSQKATITEALETAYGDGGSGKDKPQRSAHGGGYAEPECEGQAKLPVCKAKGFVDAVIPLFRHQETAAGHDGDD